MIITRQGLEHPTLSVRNRPYGLLLALLKVVSSSGITVTHALRKCRPGMMALSGHSKSKSNIRKGNKS